jgi:hypothetical protein
VTDEQRNNLITMVSNEDKDEIQQYVSSQFGDGGLFHQGPTCHFRGQVIPSFITCSPNESMTGEILADALAALYSRGFTNQPVTPAENHVLW